MYIIAAQFPSKPLLKKRFLTGFPELKISDRASWTVWYLRILWFWLHDVTTGSGCSVSTACLHSATFPGSILHCASSHIPCAWADKLNPWVHFLSFFATRTFQVLCECFLGVSKKLVVIFTENPGSYKRVRNNSSWRKLRRYIIWYIKNVLIDNHQYVIISLPHVLFEVWSFDVFRPTIHRFMLVIVLVMTQKILNRKRWAF